MARAPDERVKKAYELYKSGKKLVEIASQLSVPDGTVRRWKSTYGWDSERSDKNSERSEKKKNVKEKPIDDGTRETMLNENLTNEQRLFCIYYSKSFNATQSYLKAYGCTYDSAKAHGFELLQIVAVREEVQRLKEIKRQQILIDEADMVEFHMRIAFADIGDYVSFGQEEVPVMTMFGPVKDEDGNELTKIVNKVKLNDSVMVDTQLIKEIKEGKDGVSIKLLDRCKSMDWLDRYFLMNPMDQHKVEYDKRKLEIELIKADAVIKANEPTNTNNENDNFMDALNATAKEVWTDED